jgi:hypothetical protein
MLRWRMGRASVSRIGAEGGEMQRVFEKIMKGKIMGRRMNGNR